MVTKAKVPRRILLVDDNVDAATMLAMVLRLLGHEVVTAKSGAEGLEEGARFRPDVAILDIGMPGMDGYEVCRRLRAEPWGASIHVIALTGWGADEDLRRTNAAGFNVHLVKPVDRETLSKALMP
jgi:two-component system CheB/CheR fusion protein